MDIRQLVTPFGVGGSSWLTPLCIARREAARQEREGEDRE